MKLYWSPQTRSSTVLWMLEETGLACERVLVDIRSGAQRADWYRAINPMLKVPALVDGEATMAETAAICAYLADVAPQANLAPAIGDPARGRYLHYLVFATACIEPAIAQIFTKMEIPSGSAGWGSAERVFDVLDGELRKGPWILGDRFSAADVMIGSGLHFCVAAFKLVPPRPSFTAYLDRCYARPAWQRAQAIDAAGV
ncbi:glutathione S-transferase family protein [Methylobrevis pamukkalensis]|uniref:Glutathione S-transferase GstA n=1 Tax=Methylobrevis pamukkalensis TaxID=1439726 RepID=A0A1E3GZF2_9HYPH|nr:glutathione S-transferase family protein [Methylobrevis pamukkalensis]ODN69305.1 Glutathione S-transferase GstA [Methylobrevis pamukkalensis]